MKKFFPLAKDNAKKGEMYVEAVVTIIVITALLLFALSCLRIASIRNTGDHIAEQLLNTATYYGCFGSEFEDKVAEMTETYSNFSFTVTYDGEYFNSSYKRVQLGDTMCVTVSYNFRFGGFGTFLSIPQTSVKTGASENYWRTDDGTSGG